MSSSSIQMGWQLVLVYESLENGEMEKVWKIDRMLMVQNLPRETRDGSQRMGERMLNLVESLYQNPLLAQYRERIKQKQSFGHPAIVFTMIGHHLGVPQENTTLYYLYSTVIKSCSKRGTGHSVRPNSRTKNHSGVSRCFSQGNGKNSRFG